MIMKHVLRTFHVILFFLFGYFIAVANSPATLAGQKHGFKKLPLSTEQQAVINRVSPEVGKISDSRRYGQLFKKRRGSEIAVPKRLSASGAMMQGLRVSLISDDKDWCELGTDGTMTHLWNLPNPFINTGFIRQGKIYGFSSSSFMGYAFLAHAVFSLDGEKIEWRDDDDYFDDFSRYVIQVAYDPTEDTAYAYTLNNDATSYMFQAIDPETSVFTVIKDNVPLEDVCNGMTWCAADGNLYGYTSDRKLVLVDKATGELTLVAKMNSLVVSTMCQGFVYSPYDKAFFLALHEEDFSASLYRIEPGTWNCEWVASLGEYIFPVLECSDEPVDDKTPKVPYVERIGFDKASLSGTAVIVAPSENYGGLPFDGGLEVAVCIDGIERQRRECCPGERFEVEIEASEGMHSFSFRTLDEFGNESPVVEKVMYVGYDEPVAPKTVIFSEGYVEWSEVEEGVNGGYVDVDGLIYNIYIDDEFLASVSDGCSYSFAMPESEFGIRVASVEAVNNTQISERSYSSGLKYGSAFKLPFSVTPDDREMALLDIIDVNDDGYGWERYMYYDNSIQCSTFTYNASDDWLILPPVNFPASENLYKISFSVRSGDMTMPDVLEVAYGHSADPYSMDVVSRIERFTEEYAVYEAYMYVRESGDYRIGFHAASPGDGGGLYLKDIKVDVSEMSVHCPVAPTSLRAVAAEGGRLSAYVEFDMPLTDISGKEFPKDASLVAVLKCGNMSYEVTAAPGSHIEKEVSTSQGINEISVAASYDGRLGFNAVVSVFTGLDIPVPVDGIDVAMSADNMTVELSWNAPEEGVNGGYVNPSSLSYYFCLEDEYGDWYVAENIGHKTSYSHILASSTELHEFRFAIAVGNGSDINPVIRIGCAMAGKPVQLPLKETFADYSVDCNPIMTLTPSDAYTADWRLSSNEWRDIPADGYNMTCSADYDSMESKGLLMLPKFSTVGLSDVVMDLNVLASSSMGDIRIYAYSPSVGSRVVGEFSADGVIDPEWKKFRCRLGEELAGLENVAVLVEASFTDSSQSVVIDSYTVREVAVRELDVVNIAATPFVKMGDSLFFGLTLENIGINDIMVPEVIVELVKDEEVLKSFRMICDDNVDIPELGKKEYRLTVDTDGGITGQFDARFIVGSFDACMRMMPVEVYKDREFVIDDLTAENTEDGVSLSWTEPVVETGRETFENMAAWCFPETIGEFRNLDRDGLDNNYLSYVSFPYDREAKAFQIFSESEFAEILHAVFPEDENFMTAAEGDRFAVSICPFSSEADDWLISPRLADGSVFSFQASIVAGYTEEMEVLYSVTDDSPESFIHLETYNILSDGWKCYDVILPEGAKYIAVRHISGNFALCIDDIVYEPENPDKGIVRYEVFRNEECISESVPCVGSFVDINPLSDSKVSYYIVPVTESGHGVASNRAEVSRLGINEVGCSGMVTGGDGFISVDGFEGTCVRIISVDGRIIVQKKDISYSERFILNSGVYIVETEKSLFKVMCK